MFAGSVPLSSWFFSSTRARLFWPVTTASTSWKTVHSVEGVARAETSPEVTEGRSPA